MSSLHRAQILIEEEQYQALAGIAKREGRSISDIVREIILIHLNDRRKQKPKDEALQALDELTAVRKRIRELQGVYPGDFIREMREERDAELDRIWRGEE